MKNYIKKINEYLSAPFNGNILTYEGLDSTFILNDGASESAISNCNSELLNDLPTDYQDFLKEFNGGVLFKIEDFSGYLLLGTSNLCFENNLQKESYGLDWDKNIILFCVCIGDVEYLGFKIELDGTYKILHCILNEMPINWEIIEENFSNFLYKLIEGKGEKFWLGL